MILVIFIIDIKLQSILFINNTSEIERWGSGEHFRQLYSPMFVILQYFQRHQLENVA